MMKNVIKIFSALIIDTISWLYPLALCVLSGLLEGWLIFSVFPEIHVTVLVAIFPILYFCWLLLFLCLSALGITVLFLFVKKPKIIEFNPLDHPLLLLQFSPISISYRLMLLVTTLPAVNYFKLSPITLKWMRNFVMQAYSPKTHIGKQSVIVTWSQDPDLTYIGENVVIGSECSIVAHALNTSSGKVKYVSEPIVIGNSSTIGGNSRIGMGVKIEAGAIVEVGSNVLPYTRIGCGEVWGCNPAVFIRKRNEYLNDTQLKTFRQQIDHSELNTIIASAIGLRPEEITDELNGDNCIAWDSIAKMAIAASLYDRFNIRVPTTRIFELNSRLAIEQLISTHTDDRILSMSASTSTIDPAPSVPANPEVLPLCQLETITQLLAHRFGEPEKPTHKKKMVVAATFTAQPLGSTLELWSRAFGIPFTVEFGEFNQLEQTLLAADSDFMRNQDGLNIVLTRPEDLIGERDQDGMIRACQLLEAIKNYAARKEGLIVANLPQVVSSFFYNKQQRVEKLRFWWQEQLETVEGVQVLDFAGVVEEVGRQNAWDASFEALARAPYSQSVYQRLGIAIVRLIRKTFLPAKKVLALDCDGTLWGGRVGEDGIDGIALSEDHPGRSFRLFQQMLLELKKRGVLLVLVSKNEAADVWNVFEHHPDMVLRQADIAAYRINWKEKSLNLRELAEELNVGLDSFVFVDDSPVERLEVEMNIPMVTVVPMPEEAAHYVETLSKLWCFDSFSITSEDTMRTQLIMQEHQRREIQENAASLESYLESLQLAIEIRIADAKDLPRVTQLTQKTNQFNLSLIRRSLTEIQEIHKSCDIMILNAKDRFGDYGLVGVAILKQENKNLFLDTFLLSCRVLGRGVEEAFLSTIFDFAHQKGLKSIIAPYRLGARNGQVKAFLLKMGFSSMQSDVLEAEVVNAPQMPIHIKSR